MKKEETADDVKNRRDLFFKSGLSLITVTDSQSVLPLTVTVRLLHIYTSTSTYIYSHSIAATYYSTYILYSILFMLCILHSYYMWLRLNFTLKISSVNISGEMMIT